MWDLHVHVGVYDGSRYVALCLELQSLRSEVHISLTLFSYLSLSATPAHLRLNLSLDTSPLGLAFRLAASV